MQGLMWNAELIHKYNINGPRYTSYPTALLLTEPFAHTRVKQAIATTNDKLSLYIHLPFCHKLCYYCGCNKVITKHQGKADTYLDALEQEILLYKDLISHRGIGALHLGGGTPTFLTEEQLSRLMAMLTEHLQLNVYAGHEISIEIDPRSCSLDKLTHLRQLGFNRVSYGVQDIDPKVQIAINRVQEISMLDAIIQHSKDLGFDSINLDLIYGLPLQTPETFIHTLQQCVTWSPDRISLFSYAHLPQRFASQRKIKADTMPSAEVKLALLELGIEHFTEAGYQFIGMDHFAKPTDELAQKQREGQLQRNFQGYTTHGSNTLLGLGASSISQINGVIWQNEKGLNEYYEALSRQQLPVIKGVCLNADDTLRADLIAEIICHFTLDTGAFAKKWQIDFEEYFADSLERLAPFIADGLVKYEQGRIEVTEVGRLLVRSICSTFDRYLQEGQGSYSKVI